MYFLRVKILFSLWLKSAERQPQVGHFRLISIKSANTMALLQYCYCMSGSMSNSNLNTNYLSLIFLMHKKLINTYTTKLTHYKIETNRQIAK